MPVTRDTVNIPFETLTPLSKSLFRLDVFSYQLRLLFVRGMEGWQTIMDSILVSMRNNMITIQGPLYDDMMEYDLTDGSLISNWRAVFDNYLFMKGFIDSLVQLRIVSVNPITIYYKLLMEEAKRGAALKGDVGPEKGAVRMSEILFKRKMDTRIKPIEGVIPDDDKLFEKRAGKEVLYRYLKTNHSDGHVTIERDRDYYESVTSSCGSHAEGFVDEEIPTRITIMEDRDRVHGVIVNLFPKTPFYAFNYRNLYPKIADINRLVESGLQIVFVTALENQPLKRVEEEYRRFFADWSIPVVDYVRSDRINFSEMECLVPPPENVDGMKFVNIPNFFVIQRPLDKLHNASWSGMNTERRRGLVGIPWAKSPMDGTDISSPQPDDGFLEYFIQEGVRRRLKGKPSVQVFFPLCTIHTTGEIRRLFSKLEKTLGRSFKYHIYETNHVMGMYARNMGEWVLVRAVLRKML
jgi:hypothetical protein